MDKKVKKKVKYWLDLSDYDLETANAMLSGKRYLYVGFMCHQTIEKILKAYFCKVKNDTVPFTHSISYLAKKADILDVLSKEQVDFLDQIEPLNIEARYPSHKDLLLKSLSEQKCISMIEKTKEFQKWIKARL